MAISSIGARRISDEELLDDIRRVAAEVGGRPRVEDYHDLGRHSAGAVYGHFGSWTEALEIAGFGADR